MSCVVSMGYGLPVIALRSGGVPEIFEGSEISKAPSLEVEGSEGNNSGYLFDELSAESLNEKIKEIESLSEDQYLQMKKDARKRSEHFSEEEFKKQITEFVNSKLMK